jgi:hypothetical protein
MRNLLLALVVLFPTSSFAADYYVARNGNDKNPGTAQLPFATLTGARDAVRQLKTDGALNQPVQIWVADGEYPLHEPLVLLPQDSGTAETPITYQAMPGAHPVFNAGHVVRGWKMNDDGVWSVQLPNVRSKDWYFEQLFVNGRRAVRARSPNKFYFYMQDIREEVLIRGSGSVPESARQMVWMRPEDFRQCFSHLRLDELRDIQMLAFHKWDNTRRFIDRLDPKESSFESVGKGMKPWNSLKRGTRFIVENYQAALDAPGEWFLSRTGTLFYKPLPGEDLAHTEFVAPFNGQFLRIEGSGRSGQLVQHIKIRGLAFRYAQWLTPRGGFEPQQAAASIDAAVQCDGARHITIEDCEFSRIGSYAVWFRSGCSDCQMRRCWIEELGAGGVRIGDIRIPRNDHDRTHHITIDNNIIRHGGRIFPCAVGVWIGHSGDNNVTHNEIADFYYTGISAGWNWGYGPSPAKRNNISFNRVHHLGWGVLSDMGGIYTLGRSEGTVVRNNVFHDIHSYSYGGWGLYTDQASTGILFENNLVYNVKTGGFHQHFGRDNVVRNNIFAFSDQQQLQATRAEDHLSFTFENNIVYYDSDTLLHGAWKTLKYTSNRNCYWHSGGKPVLFLGDTLEEWQAKGHERDSIIADPRFAQPAAANFSLPDDSPVFSIGFRRFDPDQAGVYGDEAWVRKADDVAFPPLVIAPAAPPLVIQDGFERDATGHPPSGVTVHVKNKGDAILVTNETAASGQQSVKLVDAQGLGQGFYPYFTVEGPPYSSGTVQCSFSLLFEARSYIQFELRDYSASGYSTGPSFQIRDGKLLPWKGKEIVLPVKQWVRFEVETTVGTESESNWILRVEIPNQPAIEIDSLPYRDAEFTVLTWVGLTSAANEETTFFVDDFRLGEKQSQHDQERQNGFRP